MRRSDFERHVAVVELRGGATLTPDLREALLEPFLEERVLVLEARARGLVAPGDGLEAEQAAVERLLSAEVLSKVAVDDAEADAYCAAHPEEFAARETVTLRQIVVPTSNEARDVVRRLRKDPRSFALLARTRSRGPEASTGGLMGTFARGELPPELERAAFALGAGETSDVVQSPFGYHVLRADEHAEAHAASPEECRKAARAALRRRKSDLSVRAFVQGLMARAKVNHEAAQAPRHS